MDDLLHDLNDAQREAVLHGDGPLLVVAGPGSGKTRVVSRRVAALVRRGVPARAILAVTFTNRAAAELRERVERLVPAQGLWVSTFHSACARILRDHAGEAGLPRAFSIYDEEDRGRLVRRILREGNVPPDQVTPGKAARRFSDWKNAGLGPAEAAKAGWGPRDEMLAKAYAAYEKALADAGAMDFDDLLLKTLRLLEATPAVARLLQARLRHVLVDEYQDTNRVQFLLARALAAGTGNLCATGDPDQSIYAWRGADIRNILEFQEHYPGARIVRLERNYRSTASILGAAGRVIRRNRERHEKDLLTDAAAGAPVRVVLFDDGDAEGDAVGAAVAAEIAAGRPASDFAVMYRVNARSRAVERALRLRRVPYQVVRGVEFFQRSEVKDLVAWLRLAANPRDAEALARVLSAPGRGAGPGSFQKVLDLAAARALPVRDALFLGAAAAGAKAGAARGLDLAATDLRALLDFPGDGVRALLEEVLARTRYREWLAKEHPEDHPERWENVEELLLGASTHDARGEEGRGLEGFLEEVALVSDQDRFDPTVPRVTLLTLHAAKGLEFPSVFLVGCEEGVLPHARALEDPAAMEEERRLFFVGMTRARRALWVSGGWRPSGWTGGAQGPSRFLEETLGPGVEREDRSSSSAGAAPGRSPGFERDADPFDLDFGGGPPARRGFGRRTPAPGRGAPDAFQGVDAAPPEEPSIPARAGAPAPASHIRVGARVRHDRFGSGYVRAVEARGASVQATVQFLRAGTKVLDLAFARLDPAEGGP
jgi:DNA helicase-2/ATP-dependent DNA helicase PcrA